MFGLAGIHFFFRLQIVLIQLLLLNNLHTFGSSNYRFNRRSINTFVKENDDGTKQNVILVQAGAKNELIEELKKHLNQTDGNESQSSSEDDSEHSEEDQGDSDVSEERNPEDLINSELSPAKLEDAEQQRPDEVVSIIEAGFNNRKSFSCPKTKVDIVTGTSTANLNPEDIGFIAAMGDSMATGTGLWPRTDIEFRGAAFPIGGDATIDGLVTVPNILREFQPSNEVFGVSHGMGHRDQLPEHQLNVAMAGAVSASMPEQAMELVRRIKQVKEIDTWNCWALVIITIGTEEVCKNCTGPDTEALIEALDILNRGIHKALVVLVGPVHVSYSYEQKANLLKKRCSCSANESEEVMQELSDKWIQSFEQIQAHMETVKRETFNALTLPMLTVHSRYPYSLFIPSKPLLNRRGHNYAAKWLWNRLIGGLKYNLSSAVLSQDAYFCPSTGCPYFRTPDNFNLCKILTHDEAKLRKEEAERIDKALGTRFGSKTADLYATTVVIICIASVSVLTLGTLFYRRSKKGNKGRFDVLPHGPPASYRKSTVRQPTLLNMGGKTSKVEDEMALNPAASSSGAGESSNGANTGSQVTDESS